MLKNQCFICKKLKLFVFISFFFLLFGFSQEVVFLIYSGEQWCQFDLFTIVFGFVNGDLFVFEVLNLFVLYFCNIFALLIIETSVNHKFCI